MKDQKKTRIARFLAESGAGSRRRCGELVKDGRVSVNDSIISDLSFGVGKDDVVRLDNKMIQPREKVVLALNKPAGYLSTVKDDFFRKTVIHLLGNKEDRLYPAGRLDKDSRGLMILTNDGDLVYRVTHPRFNIPKTYKVMLDRTISDRDLKRVRSGLMIDKRIFRPDIVKRTSGKKYSPLIIRIHEGRKRIIRRAFKKIGYEVTDLKRVKIGGYSLGDIPEGEYRIIDKGDINKLLMIK
jgi:23S rRNA pseudouridine2605 synthase